MRGRGGRSGDAGGERKRKAAGKSAAAAKRRAREVETSRMLLSFGILDSVSKILLPHVEKALASGELLPPKTAAEWEAFGKELETALANVRAAYGRGPK